MQDDDVTNFDIPIVSLKSLSDLFPSLEFKHREKTEILERRFDFKRKRQKRADERTQNRRDLNRYRPIRNSNERSLLASLPQVFAKAKSFDDVGEIMRIVTGSTVSTVAGTGAIPHIIGAAHLPSNSVRNLAIVALYLIAEESPECCSLLIEHGAIPILFHRTWDESPKVKTLSLLTLVNLITAVIKYRPYIMSLGMLPAFFRIMDLSIRPDGTFLSDNRNNSLTVWCMSVICKAPFPKDWTLEMFLEIGRRALLLVQELRSMSNIEVCIRVLFSIFDEDQVLVHFVSDDNFLSTIAGLLTRRSMSELGTALSMGIVRKIFNCGDAKIIRRLLDEGMMETIRVHMLPECPRMVIQTACNLARHMFQALSAFTNVELDVACCISDAVDIMKIVDHVTCLKERSIQCFIAMTSPQNLRHLKDNDDWKPIIGSMITTIMSLCDASVEPMVRVVLKNCIDFFGAAKLVRCAIIDERTANQVLNDQPILHQIKDG
eukprot:TRINITY_DN9764_c0_g1_i1.p1 TRINITY_DN9764_c0_g1~~TRINITY_DN9764_c0_g1_i1.p1  ORF type:complete len:490 (-),score=74.51 TRINITY_DN9764_c0_g1_i1:27-1496(-)